MNSHKMFLPGIFILILIHASGCENKNSSEIIKDCDTVYAVQRSDSKKFENYIQTDTFYRKSKNKYSLSPDGINLKFWTGENHELKSPPFRKYYARVLGYCEGEVFFTSQIKTWVNIGIALWIDVSDSESEDPPGTYFKSDEQGNIIFHSNGQDRIIKPHK